MKLIMQLDCGTVGLKLDFNPELPEAWVSMWNTYDLSMVDELFLIGPELTYFSSEKQGIIEGINAVRKHYESFGFVKGGKTQLNKLWLENTQTEVFSNVAIVTAVWCFQRGSSTEIERGPVTLVYVQTRNEWRIAHAHFSSYH